MVVMPAPDELTSGTFVSTSRSRFYSEDLSSTTTKSNFGADPEIMRPWWVLVGISGGGHGPSAISTGPYHLRAAEGHASLFPHEVGVTPEGVEEPCSLIDEGMQDKIRSINILYNASSDYTSALYVESYPLLIRSFFRMEVNVLLESNLPREGAST
ncbi:uncharacterized protein LOC124677949 [Lolium rigidum]|uniref:uncharacterized protein LOC124677949 n=1 Tax=Lolium rigidum TaxID=89674 RepID=UPI001F5D07F4|nr:uncharacterized protein LOC124677949 [Lolium rigidum]